MIGAIRRCRHSMRVEVVRVWKLNMRSRMGDVGKKRLLQFARHEAPSRRQFVESDALVGGVRVVGAHEPIVVRLEYVGVIVPPEAVALVRKNQVL